MKKAEQWSIVLCAVVCALLFAVTGARGADVLVSTPSELGVAIAAAQPGHTIVMHDGVWADVDILFSGHGTAANPITLRAETLGRVHLTGQSRLRLSGGYLVVNGLIFTNGYRTSGDVIAFRESSTSEALNSRLTNCSIIDYCPPNPANDTKWVSLYGLSNRVENCYFKGKTNVGTTLIVWVGDAPNYHVIARNYFGPRPVLTAASNGGETIRIGTSDVSFNQSLSVVEDNFFDRCNGDVEIISSKSCGNIYRRNTFFECEGTLSLRHGNGCTVEGNYFFGNHKINTGGVRIIGEDHKVYNNYFQDLAGTSTRAPLTIMQGLDPLLFDDLILPLSGYFQVKRATVAFNTFVNCTNSFLIGLVGTYTAPDSTPTLTTLPPVDCVIANNIVLQPAGKIVDQRITPENLLWASNIFFGTTLNITNSGIAQVNPLLAPGVDTLWRPSISSPALSNAQGGYAFITADFEGDTRPTAKDIGCDQASPAPHLYPPLTAISAGPLWMRTTGTFLTWAKPADIFYGTLLGSSQLNASANAAGALVYNPPIGALLNAGGTQTLTVVFTPSDLVNFTAATQTVTINVLKATPSLVWTNPSAVTYGTALAAVQLNAAVNVAGTKTYVPPAGVVLNAGHGQTLTVTFTPTDTSNYTSASNAVTINVEQRTPAITWPSPASIEQGTALSAVQLNATADVPGTISYTPALGTVLPAGSQSLSLNFTPANTNNFTSVSRSVTLNVTVGGKTVPAITWPSPGAILAGTPLSSLQLNATAPVSGTFTYTPPVGTVLPTGNGQVLSVTFVPSDTVNYASAAKTVTLDVAPLTGDAILRVAYIVPANRSPQSHAVTTLTKVVQQYQDFFSEQMERNGFGRKTFSYETGVDGTTPLIHVLAVAATDSFLRADIYGNRVLDAARNAGLPVGSPGQIWWLIPETHIESADGTIGGGFSVGVQTNTMPVDSGWVISGSHELALYQLLYQTNALLYAGAVVPEIGPFPLVQDVSFPWFEGITLSGVSSSAVGSGLRSLGEAFGLSHDFRNDENFNGNLMGFGFRGIRGALYPDRYLYNYCNLGYSSALVLSANPFFNPGRLATDLVAPALTVTTAGTRTLVGGLLDITFNASDAQGLHAALLTRESSSEFIMADEMVLAGTNVTATFHTPFFNAQQTNKYTVTVFDQHGNRRSAQTSIFPTGSANHSAQPFIRVSPILVGLGEDVLLDASASFDPQNLFGLLEVEWDLNGDGIFDTELSPDLVFTTNYVTLGTRLVRARLTDPAGDTSISTPIAVSVQACATSLSPASKNHGFGGGTGTVSVTTGQKCLWMVEQTNDWITILSGPGIPGSGKLIYYVEPNPDFVQRVGTMMVGDRFLVVTQDANVCTYSLSPTNRFHGFGLGTNTIKITTKSGCDWAIVNTNSWITVTPTNGTDTTTVTYTITDHRVTGRRSGNLTVGEKLFTVTQWGTNCELAITPSARTHSENSETGLVTVSTASCTWTVLNTNSWITLTTNSGVNSGSFGYTNQHNLGLGARTGFITVNGEPFMVVQQACSYSISADSRAHGYGFSSSNLVVTAGVLCGWSVNNTNSWIHFTSPTTGFGNATLNYTVDANPVNQVRVGTITVAGREFTITQDQKPCSYDIDPPDLSLGAEGGYGEVTVDTDSGCFWNVVSPVSWITVVFGNSSDGFGTLVYFVQPNSGPARSATLMIDELEHVVSQESGVREVTVTDMAVTSGQTNSIFVKLDAHGGENSLSFSLCFDTNLLAFTEASLQLTAPLGVLPPTFSTNEAAQGRVGIIVSMPPTYSMPAGTGLVVKVSFRAATVNGKPSTTISFCDTPVARHLIDAVGNQLTMSAGSSAVRIFGFCSLAESLDAPNLIWTTSPIPWACQTNVTHDLEDAASSGVTPDNGESYMETTVTGPGLLSFWWKVSSEEGSDRLRFYMDGSSQLTISGEWDWERRTFSVPSGSHVLRWRYNKNGDTAEGSDRGWVDQVAYDPAPPSITSQPASLNVDEGANAIFNVTAAAQPPVAYQWLYNNNIIPAGPNVKGSQTNSLTLSNVQPSQAGSYSVIVSTPQGNVTSAGANLSVTTLLPLAEALDATSFNWTTNGNGTWVGQSGTTHDGVDAARSGNITHSQSTSFQTILTGPGTVTFWWKVSSETNREFLGFTNGTQGARISGEVNWELKSFTIGSGSQTLRWTYSKNASLSVGEDRGWVDEVRFTPAPASITTHPTNQLVDQGASATLSVGVAGTPPISYQWRLNGTDISGATSPTLTVPNMQSANTGNYSVFVSNAAGSATSSNALILVNQLVPLGEAVDATNRAWTTTGTPPWVGQTAVSQDGSDAARSGKIGNSLTTSFQTTVSGPGTVSYWWKVSSETNSDLLRFYVGGSEQQNISGEVNWTYRSWPVPSGSQVLDWRYVKNGSGTAGQDFGWVDQIRYVANTNPTVPFIAIQPTNRTVVAPATLSLSVVAGGSTPLGYQWLHNGVVLTNGNGLTGVTTTNLTLTSVGASREGDYSVIVTNLAGITVSSIAHLTVITAPVITNQPASRSVIAGATVNFAVGAIGQAPLSYQWMFNGINLTNGGKVSGATTSNLTLTGVQVTNEGIYSVIVSNAAGFAISSESGVLTAWDAARSAAILSGETTTLGTTVTGPGTIKFFWKVSSETNSDLFRFLVTGLERGRISGEEAWHEEIFAVPGGLQTLEWSYSKDAIGTAGLDAGFLDRVEFTPDGAPVAPNFYSQPASRTVGAGATITFDAGVSGSVPLAYQWRFNGIALANGGGVSGVKTPRLTLSGVQAANAGGYSLFVSNVTGVSTSGVASLVVTSAPVVVAGAPVIASQPVDQNVSENANASFSVTASGTSPFTYRWRFNGTNLVDGLVGGAGVTGSATSSLSLTNVQSWQIGNYSVLVSNAMGVSTSSVASLSVLRLADAAGAPYLNVSKAGDASWIAQQIDGGDAVRSGIIADGGNSRMETWVDGPGTVTFRWKISAQSSDELRFYIGANEILPRIAGVVGWQQRSHPVPAGQQILLKWRYGNNSTGSTSDDAGWVDDVQYVFTGAATMPAITNEPVSQTVVAGTTVTFSSGASGSPALTYQWRLNGTNLPNGNSVNGSKTPRLTLTGVQPVQAGNYSLVVSNAAGSVTSSVASLAVTIVLAAPVITSHPVSQTISEGVNVSFAGAATGAAPLSYRWQFNGVDLADGGNVSGAMTPSLTLSHVQPNQIGNYSLVVGNGVGTVSSAGASLTLLSLNEVVEAPYLNFIVNGNSSWRTDIGQTYEIQGTNGGARLTVGTLPSISSQPASQTNIVGNQVSFTAGIAGTPPLLVQWRLNGIALEDGGGIVGATTPTLLLTDIQSNSAGAYSIAVSNALGYVISSNGVLTVLIPPSITTEPINRTVPEGASVSFSVVADGSGPFTYRWRRNGTNLINGGSVSGATTPTLTLNNAQPSQGGSYSVEVSNAAGVDISSSAQLVVIAALSLSETMNAPYLEWSTDLATPWFVQTNVTHDGEAAAQSGNIPNNADTYLETVVTGPGTIRFWWKVSSQTNADYLIFSVGGSEWAKISGVVDWQKLSFSLPAGQVNLRWTYVKDGSGTNGLDRGWVDEVDYVPTTGPSVPVIVQEPLSQDVDPNTTVTFSVEALGTPPLTYQWRFEGQELADGSELVGAKSSSLTLFNVQAAQAGVYDVIVRNPYSLDVSRQVFLYVIPVIPLPSALDTTNLTWLIGGASAWRGQTDDTVDRIDAAQSGALGNNQTNWIQTTVNGPGAINFWWKTSSQTNSDRLRFAINGTEMANISGETVWLQRTFPIDNPGTVLRWSYTKDATGSAGLDRGWVDQVSFGPSAPIITNTSQEINIVDQGTTIRLNVDASGSKPFSYQWKWNGANLANSDTNLPLFPGFITGAVGNHRLTISNAQPYQSGTYVGEIYNEAGVAISPPFTVQVIPALPLGKALNTNLIWETEGSSWWVGTTNVTHDGVMAARNGTLDNARSAIMRTTVNGPGTLRFWWKASTETNVDLLTFYINGSEQDHISGNHDWQQKSFDLGSGAFVLEWEYNKNALGTNGMDQVFVDEVFWGPIPPVITNSPVSQVVDQGSTVTFTAGIRGTPPLFYQWYHNDLPLANGGNISGANSVTLRLTGVQPSQAGQYTFQVYNSVDSAFAVASLTVQPIFSIAEALDITNFTWTTGSPAWVGQGVTTHDGVDAARSPAIGDSTSASMQATIAGPGTLSFWWKVSSQTGDELSFYTNNTKIAGISGESNWVSRTITLFPGNQVVKWTYAKNGSVTNGQDRGWVDQLVFTPVPPSIVTQPVGTNVDQGATAIFNVTAGGTPPFTYQWRLDGQDLLEGNGVAGANAATLTVPNVQPDYAGAFSVVVRNGAGAITSANAALTVNTIVPLAQALDGTNFTWSTSGTPAWVGQTGVSKDGEDAARIQGVANNGSVSMQTTITGPGTISFWWMVSSETNRGFLGFTNGTQGVRISGEAGWEQKSFTIGAGTQTLKWTYSKNGSGTGGQNRAWVDQVSFGPVAPTITRQPTNTGVDAGNSVSFSVAAGGTPPFFYQWQYEGADILNGAGVSGATSSNLVLTGVQSPRAGSYRVLISGPGGAVSSSSATLSVYAIIPLDIALDTDGLTWTTIGTPPWVGHAAETHDGIDAARSGAIGDGGSTTMRTVFSGPGTVSFWWKVSSQSGSDWLTLNTNGVRADRISGESNWMFKTINIGSGTQTLDWVYSKNGSTASGQDRGWVDQVSFGLVAPTIITQPANVTADPGTNVTFKVVAAATPPIYYQWLFNGSPLFDGGGVVGANTATLTIGNVQAPRVGSYSVIVSNSVGTVTSANASLALSANVTIAQALDGSGMVYTVGGTGQPWKGQTGVSHDGVDAAQSGAVGDSTYTFIKATVVGPGPLTFWWRVSSEQDHDYLKFMVDGVEVPSLKISGEPLWQMVTYNVANGSHELQWRYSKNASLADGQDRGWVDQVYFKETPPSEVSLVPPSILIQPVSQSVDADNTINISVAMAGSMPMTYRWLRDGTNVVVDGGNVGGATTEELVLYNVIEPQAGNYSVVVSNAAGTVTSLPARLTVLPVVDLAEAVDATALYLTTSGDAGWIGHTVVTHDGTDAARSGIILDGQSSTLETMLNGPGTFGFWWKVSSETNSDALSFSLNGIPQATISGEEDWRFFSINLPAGLQFLDWTYFKNGSEAVGADHGWVDQVSFTPIIVPPPVTNAPTSVVAVQLSVTENLVQLVWEANAAKTYKVFFKDDLSEPEWTLLDGEVSVAWKVVDGAIVPDVVIATTQDVLGGPTRFYKVLEY